MNFPQAFLWMALLLAIVLFGSIFYVIIRKRDDKKDNPRNNNEKQKARKRASASADNNATAKADQPGRNNFTHISHIDKSHIEVINITNCPFKSEVTGNNQLLQKEEQVVEQ